MVGQNELSARGAERRLDLDWVRIGAFMLLILYHAGMFYVPWDWHVKSSRTVQWLEPLMVLVNPWRLVLLFVVSGAATRYIADKVTPGALAAGRTVRLLPPLLLGMTVVVPPQVWLELGQSGAQRPDSYGTFLVSYLAGAGGWTSHGAPLATPTWNHLWFVAYLLVYTLALGIVLRLAPTAMRKLGTWASRMFDGLGILIWPAAWFVAVRSLLAPHFPETHALIGDWTVHAEAVPAFLLGYLLAKIDAPWDMLVRQRWNSLGLALLAYGVHVWAMLVWPGEMTPPDGWRQLLRVTYGIDQWAWIATVLGFARLHLRKLDTGYRRYLTDAIFPFYLVHQTVIMASACWLTKFGLPLLTEAFCVMTSTLIGCFLTYEIVRRIRVLRPLFGLKVSKRGVRTAVYAAWAVG